MHSRTISVDEIYQDTDEAESLFDADSTISHPQVLYFIFLLMEKVDSQFSFVVVMVGLPARGKSYIARQLSKYLNWLGVDTELFNAGEYRRKILGPGQVDYIIW